MDPFHCREIPLESGDPPDQPSNTPEHNPRVMDTPRSERADPTYYPPKSPKSRREIQTTRTEPILTRARARTTLQEPINHSTDTEM